MMAGARDSAIVFGYGSLIFRPDIDYHHAEWARLKGFARRFFQGSTDHRGVPGAPGRVVTLVPDMEAETWGMAYHVPSAVYAAMVERLDQREVGGYQRLSVTVHARDGRALENSLLYVANAHNEAYLGEAPLSEMAIQILRAQGPSGSNRDYLFHLAEALRAAGIEDAHVFALEASVRAQMVS